MTDAGPLTRRSSTTREAMQRLVPDIGTPADWAPLAAFVAVDEFERVGTFLEVQDWQQYTEMLTAVGVGHATVRDHRAPDLRGRRASSTSRSRSGTSGAARHTSSTR